MEEEADYKDVTIPLGKEVLEGTLDIGHLPDAEKPTVGMHLVGVGLMMLSPAAARLVARLMMVEADRAEGNHPSHIYMVDNRE